MLRKRRRAGGIKRTRAAAVGFGILLSVVAFFVTAFIAAAIISRFKNPTGSVGMTSLAVLMITAAFAGFCTAKYKGEGGALPAIISALVFALGLLTVGVIKAGGRLPLHIVINLCLFVLISAVFAWLGGRRAARKRHR